MFIVHICFLFYYKVSYFCCRLKQEAKLFLLWEKAINILLIQARTSYTSVVPHISSLATVLSRAGEDKATEGILGVIGLGKKSLHSYQ